jgi:hypothetical protein
MTNVKIVGVVIVLSVAVTMPVFAKEHGSAYNRYRGAYNQLSGPSYAIPDPRAGPNIENFGFSARDLSQWATTGRGSIPAPSIPLEPNSSHRRMEHIYGCVASVLGFRPGELLRFAKPLVFRPSDRQNW